MDRRTALLRSVPLLSRWLSPKLGSSLAKYLYLADTLRRHAISLVIDVGANAGQFGEALRALGYRGRIVSFEPMSEAFASLSATAAADGRWDVIGAALGEREGAAELSVMRSSVFSSLHAPVPTAQFAEENVVARREEVPVRRLDAVVDELGLRAELGRALLKTDTQGHDRSVLEGMSYIGEVALIQAELNVMPLYEDAPSMTEMIDYITGLGFAPVLLSPINHGPDGSAVEFDYLAVNTALRAAGGPVPVASPSELV